MPLNVKCKNCNNLTNGWCEKKIDSPDPNIVRDCQYFWEKTNADRIRAMSDEEFVKFIGHNSLCDQIQNDNGAWCKKHRVCEDCLVDWLKQPAEE